MRRGLGGIYLRGKTYWIHFSVRGRVVRRSAETDDKEVALRVLNARRIQHGLSVPQQAVTFETLREILTENYKLTQRKSLPAALRAFRKLALFFGGSAAHQITSARLSTYARSRQEDGAAPATFKYELCILMRAMNLARKADLLERVPSFPTIAVHNVRAGFMEDEDFWAIYEYVRLPSKPAVLFTFWTGWRRGDVVGLRWRQVDLQHGTIMLERGLTKNRGGRLLPYRAMPELAAIIEEQLKDRGADERVFRISGSQLGKDWNAARVKAGKPKALLHDFRRTAARRYVRKGVNEKVAMQLLGMKTRSIFDRYLIVSERDMESALRLISPSDPSQDTHKAKKKRQ
jgi:integrase